MSFEDELTRISRKLTTRMGRFTAVLSTLLSLWVLAPEPVEAQQYFDPGVLQRPILRRPGAFQPSGARVGSFMFHTGALLGYTYNDNVFYLPENEISDSAIGARVDASLASDWNRHALNVTSWVDGSAFVDNDLNDYVDWSVRADGRLDVTRNNWFSVDAHYMNLHEDRRSPDSNAAFEPTDFDFYGFGIGYDHVFNRLRLGVYFNRSSFDYEDNQTLDGEFIDNSFRDRTQDRLTFRGDYQISGKTSVFGRVGFNEISYDVNPDANGNFRESEGTTAGVGIVWDITGVWTGDLSLNWFEQRYEDPAFRDVDGWGLAAGLTWTPRATSVVQFRFATSPQETNQPGTSGYFSRLYSVRYQEDLRENLLFHVRASATDNDYFNPGLSERELAETQVYRGDIGLTYLFGRNFGLTAGYTYETQDSNLPAQEYVSNRFFVTLGVEL